MECAFCSLMRESANEIAPRRLVHHRRAAANCSSAEESEAIPLPLVHVVPVIHSLRPLRFHCISLFSACGVFIAGARASVRNVCGPEPTQYPSLALHRTNREPSFPRLVERGCNCVPQPTVIAGSARFLSIPHLPVMPY